MPTRMSRRGYEKDAKNLLIGVAITTIALLGQYFEYREQKSYSPENEYRKILKGKEDSEKESRKININTATPKALSRLDGIGDLKATAIVQYREENGQFETIEEIMKVDGIAKEVFNRIKKFIKV